MIVPPTPENISLAATLLCQGKLVAFPTETVYGLGADATNEKAVQKIFDAKNRPTINPLIVHVASIDAVDGVADLSADPVAAERLKKVLHLWPGPFSAVLPRKSSIVSLVSAGLPSVAVRIPNHPIALSLLKEVKRPIAAPSANPSSYVSPTTARHVEAGLGAAVDLILDGGACPIGIESTVVSLLGRHPLLLRPGFITFEELQSILPDIQLAGAAPVEQDAPLSPGLLREHYAPRTPIALRTALSESRYPARVGLIAFRAGDDFTGNFDYSVIRILSQSGQLTEVAANLFAAIRELDQMQLDLIVVDSCPAIGLGRAIMDRLVRATAKFSPG